MATSVTQQTQAVASIGTRASSSLMAILGADDIEPGSAPSYELCKIIYEFHPLGAKIVEKPLKVAQSQKREISIPDGPEEKVREQFERTREAINADGLIFDGARLARTYGISAIAILVDGESPNLPLDLKTLATKDFTFNAFDPLNTAGSLVGNLDPNSPNFLKQTDISVQGVRYHRTRIVIMLNERPIYLGYTPSAYGYTGRSVYQRALLPLKSFIQSEITDDMVIRKVGLIIAKLKAVGSIIDNLMQKVASFKRVMLQQGQTGNVLSIDKDEDIESLDLTNLEGPYGMARKNVIENIASSADMPAIMLNEESFAEGFGEGTEDSKKVASYVEFVRKWMAPLYSYFDTITMYRAWTPEFFEAMQNEFPDELGGMKYEEAFMRWKNSFAVQWPSLLTEPDSELVKVDEVKLRSVIALVEVFWAKLDPDNRAILMLWAADSFNELKMMFGSPLVFNPDTLVKHVEEQSEVEQEKAENEAKPEEKPVPTKMKKTDADLGGPNPRVAQLVAELAASVAKLPMSATDRRRAMAEQAVRRVA